jgi:catechol 2,3-dioxygenase-like lactoylglutathione lyase family enzyme
MKRFVVAFAILFLASNAQARKPVRRPAIYGIAHVRFQYSDQESSLNFYARTLGYGAQGCKDEKVWCFPVGGPQFIELSPAIPGSSGSFVEEVGFLISDVSAMRKFLLAQGLHPGRAETHGYSANSRTTIGPVSSHTDFENSHLSVAVNDPEGNRIVFVERHEGGVYRVHGDPRAGKHIIHAGFVVRNRAATDHFYKEILGFRPYWHGGMKDDKDDWVAMQVPDGTDWVEYMLNVSFTADKQELGVMNHIAIGVPNIQAAKAQLLANGWKPGEEPQMGRDGKWQLNLYDPDDTRIEFMEFTPVQKPCCSEYTGPHPKP